MIRSVHKYLQNKSKILNRYFILEKREGKGREGDGSGGKKER